MNDVRVRNPCSPFGNGYQKAVIVHKWCPREEVIYIAIVRIFNGNDPFQRRKCFSSGFMIWSNKFLRLVIVHIRIHQAWMKDCSTSKRKSDQQCSWTVRFYWIFSLPKCSKSTQTSQTILHSSCWFITGEKQIAPIQRDEQLSSQSKGTISLILRHMIDDRNKISDSLVTSLKSSSLPVEDIRVYHFDQRNCLIQCRHSSDTNDEQQRTTWDLRHPPDIVFARSTT